ncbi:MAG: cadherin-like beta sandwich domain-containing protein [Bacilli bacterium]|nr:cadherin-like beta sandwich domain-containing protein [Bacilli bacterium]
MRSKQFKHNFVYSAIGLFLFLVLLLPFFSVAKAAENVTADSIMQWVSSTKLPDGNYNVTVTGVGTGGTEKTVTYPIELINYYDDVTYGASINLGDTSTEYKMLVVKYWKNVTINSGVTVSANKNGNYTYKKGMYLHVSGTLTNYGRISMSARGTYNLAGEDVFLWKNISGIHDFIPAKGAAGGTAVSVGGSLTRNNGRVGTAGTNRQTGGGASGGSTPLSGTTTSGAGGAGTSYSGGSGGGGAYNARVAGAGSSVGGPGGNGNCGTTYTTGCGGGAGNPGGAGAGTYFGAGALGNGGLLVVYATEYNNLGTVDANGSKGGDGYRAGAGGSGGGSINIYSSSFTAKGTATATGGSYGVGTRGGSERSDGAIGGVGSITYTTLVLDPEFLDPTLSSLKVDKGTMQPSTFDSAIKKYVVGLDSEDYKVNISATVTNEENLITSGVGEFEIPSGSSIHNVVVTSAIGVVKVYEIEFYRQPSSYEYLDDILIDDKEIENFKKDKYEYTVSLPYDKEEIDLGVKKGRTSQQVDGLGIVKVPSGTSTKKIEVISEDGSSTKTYTIHFEREHSSNLKSIQAEDYELKPEFASDIYEYALEIPANALSVNVEALAYDSNAVVKVTGNGYIKGGSGTITITVTEPHSSTKTYKIYVTKEGSMEEQTFRYECTNKMQTFEAPVSSNYKFQLWGARGGYGRTHYVLKYRGGYGAYTEGEIYLKKGEKIYLYVGCAGQNSATASRYTGGYGGFNGGAKGGDDSNRDGDPEPGGGGGGATDLRLEPTTSVDTWNEFDSLKSRIMVAAGGGGGNFSGIGGAGGKLTGDMGHGNKQLPTQTSGYAFGYGMVGGACTDGAGGGGGGYYGGYTGNGCNYGGGGGSSYISGYDGSIAVLENSVLGSIKSSTDSIHYSKYAFENSNMIAGTESMPNINGGFMVGNNGNGVALVTVGASRSTNNFLSSITVDKGTLSPAFNMETSTYDVTLTDTDTSITLGAKPEEDTATITGLGKVKVPSGTTSYPIVVTAEDGSIRTYTVRVTRPASSLAFPNTIRISGLVPSLCSVNASYCKLDQEFSPSTHTYHMSVPSRIKQLQFTVNKAHDYQQTTGDGVVSLSGGMNIITIEVMSEDGKNIEPYTYYIDRDMTGNASIENLEVVNPPVNINFVSDITEYYFSVSNEYNSLDLKVELEDEEATYIVKGNENFETGMNLVEIEVTARNGEKNIYTLNVYKEQSGNTYLKELEVKDGTETYPMLPTFNKFMTEYTVTVPSSVENVELKAQAEHPLTVLTGLGTKTLVTGVNAQTVTATSEDGSVSIYHISIIREKSKDATLQSLDILEGTLTPTFTKEGESYQVEVSPEISSLHINAVTNHPKASYKIKGNSSFKAGANKVEIVVTAENGNQKTYTLTVNKQISDNNYLSDLNTDIYDMTGLFQKETETYNFTVESDVSKIKVNAVKESAFASLKGTGSYQLKKGDNTIEVSVIAEDGNVRVYTLHVFRKYSSNANLFTILSDTENALEPLFQKEITEYQMHVDNAIKNITLTGIAEEASATVSGNGTYSLHTGENVVTIKTTSEDGTEKAYKITIVRDLSSNTNLSSITAKEGSLSPKFNKEVTSYQVKVLENVTSLDLTVLKEDDTSTYEIIGNKDFILGENLVIIKVTAQDGTSKQYTLKVIRQESGTTSNALLSLITSKGTLSPKFNKDTLFYTVEVPYEADKITVDGVAEDIGATITGLGEAALAVGDTLLPITVTSTEGIERTYQILVKRSENNEARLSNITVSSSALTPNFQKDVYSYSLKSYQTKLALDIVTVDPSATYEIIGNENLQLGENLVTIKVTAKDKKTTKVYSLYVTREKSNNNNLESLSTGEIEFTPTFSKTTTIYSATVARNVNNIQIEAKAEDPLASVEGIGSTDLEVGMNYKQITVTSESGKVKVYTLAITRTPSDVNTLKNLTISEGSLSPVFESTQKKYTVEVPYEIDKLSIMGEALDDTATITGLGTQDLKVGKNIFPITVTSEKGTSTIYEIEVTRKEIVSSKLKTLSIKNYTLTPTFSSDVTDYVAMIDYEVTSLDLHLETLDTKATYKIIGNENFKVGMNEVKIEVTDSQSLTTTIYTLNINRQNYSNTFLRYIALSEGTLVPNFEKTTLSYSANLPNDIDEISLEAEAEATGVTVKGTGTYALKTGKNDFNITVETASGIKRTYMLFINRDYKNDNYLETLEAKIGNTKVNMTPVFDKNTQEYTLEVPEGTDRLQFVGTVSEGAKVEGLGTVSVKAGENKYTVLVTSESGNVKTYTVNVTRKASNNAFLAGIEPSTGNLLPDFSYYETEYSISLDSATSLLSFAVATDNQYAKVTGIEEGLVPDGQSTRTITVTAEDGSMKMYTIHIYKDRSDEARLSKLEMKDYALEETFDPDTFSYHVTVPNDKKVLLASEITAETVDKNATVIKPSSLTLSAANTNVYTVLVTAKDGFTTQAYHIYITREKGSEALLSKLEFANGILTPNFNSKITDYTLTVTGQVSEILGKDVIAQAIDDSATVIKTEKLVLNKEDNLYTVRVISGDTKTELTYNIHVVYLESKDATLKSLEISKGTLTPAFASSTYGYSVSVLDDTESIDITGVVNDPNATIISGTGTHALTEETTHVDVVVQAEDGTLAIYKIEVKKNITKAKLLENISLSGDCTQEVCPLSPSFEPEVFSYETSVPYEVENINIDVEKKNQNQIVKFYNQKTGFEITNTNYALELGKNKIRVDVTNGIGETTSYTVNITRRLSSNNNLTDLKITNVETDLSFDKDTLEYFVTIPNEYDKVVIETVKEASTAKVSVNGATNLTDGNNDVFVTVTAQNGSVKQYIIHVFKESATNYYLQSLTVSSGIIYPPTPTFYKGTFDYVITVPNEVKRITLDAVPEKLSTTVVGTGEKELITGVNTFTLTTTSEGGESANYNVIVNRLKSTKLLLKTLSAQEGPFTETFDPETFSYTMDVDGTVDQLHLNAVPKDAGVTYKITGNNSLITGKNTVLITLTNADKTVTSTYKINVNKQKSTNNYLSSLKLDNKELLGSDPDKTVYTETVASNVDSITLTGKTAVPSAYANGFGTYSLAYGENKITISVKAEDGSTRSYEVTIKREYDLSLSMLTVDRGEITPAFDPNVTEYSLEVSKDIADATVLAVPSGTGVKVMGNGFHKLKMGENNIPITVMAEDGISKTYTLHIERKESHNNYLKDLYIHEGYLKEEFDKENLLYTAEVPDTVKKLTMDVTPEDPSATYEIIGNENLKNGENEVTVIVTAEDGTKRTYTVQVLVQDASLFSNRLVNLTVSKGNLSPNFNPDTLSYTVSVPNNVTSITINGVLESVDAKVTGLGTYTLVQGRNSFPIVLTSKDKKTRTYSVIVYRIPSSDARLKSIAFKEGSLSPVFDKDKESYVIHVGNTVSRLTEKIEPFVEGTTYEVIGNENLQTGTTLIKVIATANDGYSKKTYTITVDKQISNNNYLSSLTSNIGVITPAFDKNETGPYTIEAGENVNSIVLSGVPESENAKVTGLGLHTLHKGINNIPITVTSEAGVIRTYIVLVNQALSSDNSLSFLATSDGSLSPSFNKDTLSYTIDVDSDVTEMTILGISSHANATINGNGNYKLEPGQNEIKMTVTAENGSVRVYTVTVNRKAEASSKILDMRALEGLLTPTFEKNTVEYTMNVPNEVTALHLNVTLEDANATYEIINNQNFKVGTNQVLVRVTATDGLQTTYKINVIRQTASNNYLKSLTTDRGQLAPSFDRLEQYYEIEVESNVSEIKISGVPEAGSATVDGNGAHSLNKGENYIPIKVTSNSGIERIYTIKVTRKSSSDSLLSNLTISTGTLSPAFAPSTKEYTVDLPVGTSTLTLGATANENASIEGLGTKTVKTGNNTYEIVVTAEDGSISIYKITANKVSASNTNIVSLTPSKGTLEPFYNNSTDGYEVLVPEDASLLSFAVALEDENATVKGNEERALQYGENLIEIVVTAEDGTEKTVHIRVIRPKNITDIETEEDTLVMRKNEELELDVKYLPVDATNTELGYESSDEDVVTIENGVLTSHEIGSSTITIYSKQNPSVKKIITVNVLNLTLSSSIYEVRRDPEISIVIGPDEGESLSAFVSKLDNMQSIIKFYDIEGNPITDIENTNCATGQKVAIEYGKKTYDEAYIVVRGDLNGDSNINVTDYNTIVEQILGKRELKNYEFSSGDLIEDAIINVSDSVKLRNYILGKVESLNR